MEVAINTINIKSKKPSGAPILPTSSLPVVFIVFNFYNVRDEAGLRLPVEMYQDHRAGS